MESPYDFFLLSAALVYASYWMIVWDFSEHPDAPVDNKKKSYGDSIQRQAELSCKNHCLEIPSAVSYTMRLSEKDSKFFCSCYNENKVLIIVTEWEIR